MDWTSSIVERGGGHLVRIPTGATPGDLRVPRRTMFERVTTLETPKALGSTIPPARRRIG
jgi:hypothetical protein